MQRDSKYKMTYTHIHTYCTLRKMRNTGIDECLVRWTSSFMQDRRVIMSVDGQDGQEMAVTTGLPQGSPVSPVLFALYIAEIHEAVEGQVEDCRGISFVDDVTWIVEGYDINEVASKLEECAAASLRWAEDNAVRFETSKTEAILFSRKRKHRQCQRGIRVGDQTVRFAPGATRWLGIWLDSAPTLQENRRRGIGKTRQAVEPQVLSESKTFPGLCEIAPEAQAFETAREWRAQGTIWTDGSRFDDGKVGAACAWQTEDGWTGRLFHLGNNKEVFDAEIFAIYQALKVFETREQTGRKYAVFSDSQAAIRRAATDTVRPGQQWARAIMEVADRVIARGNEISIIWVLAHRGVPGNEVVDGMAKTAAGDTSYEAPDQVGWQTSLPHLARRATERRTRATT